MPNGFRPQVLGLAILLCGAALTAGCVAAPERKDPLSGLKATTPAYRHLTLGLIHSDNTKNSERYALTYAGARGPWDPEAGERANKLVAELGEVFQRNFKAVKRLDAVEDAKVLGVDVVGIWDLYLNFPTTRFDAMKIDHGVIFVSPDNQPVETIKVEAAKSSPFGLTGFGPDIEAAAKDATEKMEAALRGSLKLAEFSRARPGLPTAVAAVQPAASGKPGVSMSDVDVLPARAGKTNKNAYAIVIGIEQYREKLPKADYAERDATLMGDYLTKVLGYPEQNVVVRVNDRAARTDLEKYFEGWLPNHVEKDSSVFIYYSGHGAPNPKSGDAYLVPYDGDPTFVEKTAYPLKRLYAALDKLPARQVTVVLDSCFSGAGGRSVLAAGARPMGLSVETAIPASGKTVVLAASSGDQISSTFQDQGHGLLTYFFLKGLQGDGDVNKDGVIEMNELFEFLKPNVERVARRQYNNEQTPQLLASPDVLKKGGGRLLER